MFVPRDREELTKIVIYSATSAVVSGKIATSDCLADRVGTTSSADPLELIAQEAVRGRFDVRPIRRG
jgi:hypothetical protein